jgi:glycyl-tRNA synthetase (class II)
MCSCYPQEKTETQLISNFIEALLLEEMPLKQLLVEYTVLSDNDFIKDPKIMMGYCDYFKDTVLKDMNLKEKYKVELVTEKNLPRGISLRKGEKAYLVSQNKDITVVVLNNDSKIISYFLDIFHTKGNKKSYKPAYLKEMLDLKMEK